MSLSILHATYTAPSCEHDYINTHTHNVPAISLFAEEALKWDAANTRRASAKAIVFPIISPIVKNAAVPTYIQINTWCILVVVVTASRLSNSEWTEIPFLCTPPWYVTVSPCRVGFS